MRQKLPFVLLLVLLMPACKAFAVVIKHGMTLSIVVKDDPALTQTVKVRDDGTIDYPLYQDIPVVDKTTSELQDILTFRLAKVVETPLVLVSAVESPLRIFVLGQVNKPGLVQAPPRASLQEVLLLAGGPTDQADLEKVKLVRRNQTDEEASFYDVESFLATGNLDLLPELKDGDRIILLSTGKSSLIKVLGAVNKPGFYPLKGDASVFDVIYVAGGPTKDANLSRIRILGEQAGQKTDFLLDLQHFLDEGRTEEIPLISEGDVVLVYNKTFTWTKSLQVVRDIVTLITAWFVVSQVFN